MGGKLLRNKILIVLTILLVSLFAISCVSASEIHSDEINTDDLSLSLRDDTTQFYVQNENYQDIVDTNKNILENNEENSNEINEKGINNDSILNNKLTNRDDNIFSEDSVSNTKTLNGGTFEDIKTAIDNSNDGDTIELNGTFIGDDIEINVTKSINIKGNDNTLFDGKYCSFSMDLQSSQITLEKINFINFKYMKLVSTFVYSIQILDCNFINCSNSSFGIRNGNFTNCNFINSKNNIKSFYFNIGQNMSLINCNFVNCFDPNDGMMSGMFFNDGVNSSIIGCNFINCSSNCALFYWRGTNASIIDSTFINCSSSIYWRGSNFLFFNDTFINCSAISGEGGPKGVISTCTFIGCYSPNSVYNYGATTSNMAGANVINCIFINNSAQNTIRENNDIETFYGNNVNFGAKFLNNLTTTLTTLNHTIVIFKVNGKTYYVRTDENGYAKIDLNLDIGTYEIISINPFTGQNKTNKLIVSPTILSEDVEFSFGENSYRAVFLDKSGDLLRFERVRFTINGENHTLATNENGEAELNFNLGPDIYNITLFNIVTGESKTNQILINKVSTKLTTADVITTYDVTKNIVIILKDSNGKILANKKVSVKVGSISKTLITDAQGKVSVLVSSLVPGIYVATISFEGDNILLSSSATAKVVVNKATPKLTASAKIFKVNVKTKKYAITLKNNNNQVMKNTKVTLKVNGKTYSVKTNSKGVAAFKITNLKKKGKFTAVVTYAGSKYYNKVTKKPKITIKA